VKNANPVSRLAVIALLVALPPGLLSACAKENAGAKAAGVAAKPISHFFPIKVGDKVVRMQLAVRSAEMQRGLIERRDLGRDDGMIFVYEKPQQLSFWMRNTPTALDIGFFNATGVLEEVYPLYPFDETSVPSRGRELQFALEMNQGWFRESGVKPGAKLDTVALATALKERGFDPRKFGL
jgi:uncharacterized membrane protein (UPF0127 family)